MLFVSITYLTGDWVGFLTGQKMLDLSRLLPGPYCSLLLADLGMEVLKVEDPEQGDYMRKMGPIRKKESAYFLSLNRNKKSFVLNLKTEEGKIRQVGHPIKSSQFDFEVRIPPPAWGEHTMEVLKAIGYSEEEIKHFREVKAI